jgi:mannose-6-phosphate isomerase-like protein (cupin superfamily)
MPAMRRVVTGCNAVGAAFIASDTAVEATSVALMPGAEFTTLWGGDTQPVVPNDGAPPNAAGWFPPAAGYRVQQITIPPDAPPPANLDMPAAMAEMNARLPGLLSHLDPDHPGMHRTDTVDVVYVLSGRCVVELDDGVKVELSAGDSIVQNGTRHAWRVPYTEPCRLLSISIGALRSK